LFYVNEYTLFIFFVILQTFLRVKENFVIFSLGQNDFVPGILYFQESKDILGILLDLFIVLIGNNIRR